MKKWFLLVPLLLAVVLALVGAVALGLNRGSVPRLNNDGNDAFAQARYEEALAAYHSAQAQEPQLAEPHYNAANTHYRQAAYDQAQQEIEQALLGQGQQAGLDQYSYYNLGNNFFQAQQYEAAIEAYKEALRLNPDDLAAKQNLELALRQFQQQEQQQDDQQQDQQQDQPQDDQQQEGQQDDQQSEQQDSQQDDQQQDQQDDQQQDQPQDQPQAGQQDDQQQEQPPQDQAGSQPQQMTGLTEEQARQLLAAAAEGTESLAEFLQQILVSAGLPPAEDW
jgi:Ca-activated chloride channel family protein